MGNAKLYVFWALLLGCVSATGAVAGNQIAWEEIKTTEISVFRTDAPACRTAKILQIKHYDRLSQAKQKPCATGKGKSCAALIATLNGLVARTNKRIMSSCHSPWMLQAAGLGADGSVVKPLVH